MKYILFLTHNQIGMLTSFIDCFIDDIFDLGTSEQVTDCCHKCEYNNSCQGDFLFQSLYSFFFLLIERNKCEYRIYYNQIGSKK